MPTLSGKKSRILAKRIEHIKTQKGALFMGKHTDEQKTEIKILWALVLLSSIMAGFCIGSIISSTKEAAAIYYEDMGIEYEN